MSEPSDSRSVALVTGASRGIGKAVAIALAEAGLDVAVGARTVTEGTGVDDARPDAAPLPGSLDETAVAVEGAGGRALAVRMDLHDRDSLDAAVDRVMDDWGRLDVLVNNAVDTGPGSMTRFADTDPDVFARKMEANYLAQLHLIRVALPHLLPGSRIVNLTSASGTSDPKAPAGEGGWGLAYSASKAAFHRVAGVLAVEYADEGLAIFNIDPGMVMTEKMAINQREMGLENKFPVAPPSVPAAVAAWLATADDAPELSGQTVIAQSFAKEHDLHDPWW